MPWLAGIPRDEVDWAPRVDPEKCVRCGMCMNCGKHVFEWTEGPVVVVRPTECVVGCTTCGTLCLGGAITFPDPAALQKQYKEHNVWKHVKDKLIEAGVIPD